MKKIPYERRTELAEALQFLANDFDVDIETLQYFCVEIIDAENSGDPL